MVNTFSDEDKYWMGEALKLAAMAAQEQEVPVGAIIVSDGKILGKGFNAPISTCDPTAHAEIQALRKACQVERNYRLPGTTLYVSIEPCSMCAAAIVHARVGRVVFGAPEPKAGAGGSASDYFAQDFLNHRVKVEGGCLETECRSLIQDFFAQRRLLKKQLKGE